MFFSAEQKSCTFVSQICNVSAWINTLLGISVLHHAVLVRKGTANLMWDSTWSWWAATGILHYGKETSKSWRVISLIFSILTISDKHARLWISCEIPSVKIIWCWGGHRKYKNNNIYIWLRIAPRAWTELLWLWIVSCSGVEFHTPWHRFPSTKFVCSWQRHGEK